ncbi:MAG TPA: hypothetical protein EYH36_07795 [Desulfocapsa sulfexigens]|nr:hypothetical protein [Desulfocapsa sulfexigens]
MISSQKRLSLLQHGLIHFLRTVRYTAEENKTRAKLRLHLPGAKDRLNLLISANDDEDFEVDRSNSINSRDKESDLTGSLQFFFKQTEKINISTFLGLSTRYAYAGGRYRGYYDYDAWQGRFTSRLRYYTDDGFESRNQYDIERQVSE